MKKIITTLISLLLILTLVACSSNKGQETSDEPINQLEAIKAAGAMNIATEGMWAPYTYEETDEIIETDASAPSDGVLQD